MLKNQAIKGFSWTIFEGIFSQGFLFIVGIILARILTPDDFGVIGIITAIIAICNSVVEGGLGNALIRKIDANQDDYNTVFITNILIGILFYSLLFLFSREIASYFDIPILTSLLRYSGLLLLINALSIIQRTLLYKNLNFKIQSIVSIISSTVGGSIAIIMAYNNYGVWSLVALAVLKPLINGLLLWFFGDWTPNFRFSIKSFNELFDYGYKLLITNLINNVYKNFYKILIGKLFSTASLGYYTRAEQFQIPFSTNITLAINRISFPILSIVQMDSIKLKRTFVKFLRFGMLLNFTIMSGVAAMSKPIVLILVGEKWSTSILFLQLLCVQGMLYPLQILHQNLLLVKGYSNLNLRLELIKKAILIPIILSTVFYSILALLFGLILFAIIEYFVNSFYTQKILDYSKKEQLKDIFPFLIIAIGTFLSMYSITFLRINLFHMMILQMVIGVLFFILINKILKLEENKEMKIKLRHLLSLVLAKIWRKEKI